MKIFFCLGFFSLVVLAHIGQGADKVEEPLQEPQVTEKSEASSSNDASQSADESESPTKVADEAGGSEEDKKYALGSLCNYCSYCKFCELCDKDCPCETSKKKPNCHLCKYCKYCSLCNLCDTVCTPGGIVDVLSSAIYSSLPSFDKETKEKVDKDIDSARKWIKEYL